VADHDLPAALHGMLSGAGTFGPNAMDPTFGPQLRFQKVPSTPNQPLSGG
jgi:hypothetical protein